MSFLGNVIWFLTGGFFMGLGWWFFGLLAFVSIIGIPWGRACFMLGTFSFSPFGKVAVRREVLYGRNDVGTGFLGSIGNIIWFFVAGLWLAIGHLVCACVLGITIIGIPFAWQHLKLASAALLPIGMTVVNANVAEAAQRLDAEKTARKYRD